LTARSENGPYSYSPSWEKNFAWHRPNRVRGGGRGRESARQIILVLVYSPSRLSINEYILLKKLENKDAYKIPARAPIIMIMIMIPKPNAILRIKDSSHGWPKREITLCLMASAQPPWPRGMSESMDNAMARDRIINEKMIPMDMDLLNDRMLLFDAP